MDENLTMKARRMTSRSGMPLDPPPPPPPEEHVPAVEQRGIMNTTVARPMGAMVDNARTREEKANERLSWEKKQGRDNSSAARFVVDGKMSEGSATPSARSALSARMAGFVGNAGSRRDDIVDDPTGLLDPLLSFANDGKSLKDTMVDASSATSSSSLSNVASNGDARRVALSSLSSKDRRSNGNKGNIGVDDVAVDDGHNNMLASAISSELIARAGSGSAFTGSALGVGGLDDVLSQIQRRVWTPLAAPPALLMQLGIQPVRGLLLYGHPGCGKTLLARKLGEILSPCRPITIVSGPEIMDKFVGSSEKNLRDIFDSPPELFYEYKKNYGSDMSKQALHVIVLDGERELCPRL
jgi:hypothetical protein